MDEETFLQLLRRTDRARMYPPGDHLPRHVCPACAAVHYENPRIVVGCVPEADDGRILICLRAIEPRRGWWTMPAGFMENGETLRAGAARECQEEALARGRGRRAAARWWTSPKPTRCMCSSAQN